VSNRIHPTAIVGAGVILGRDNTIGPFTVIVGPCEIGDGNWLGPFASIGTPAEYRGGAHPVGWEGEVEGAGVLIGDGNTIRDFVTINQGTEETTTIGDDCYLLARSHVGHDCVLHDGVTLADGVQLGGHTQVWAWTNIGMGTVVHERTNVGPGAMIVMGSALRRDVRPFTITVGNPARAIGVNHVGLSRRGCTEDEVAALETYLKGKAELPANLPSGLADTLAAWAKAAGEQG